MSKTVHITVRQALQIAQNTVSGQVDPQVLQILDENLAQIWSRIRAHPDTYIMSGSEFAVFNYFRARSELQNETARKAVQRYWDNRSTTSGGASRSN
jgi:hypothetical protein